MVKWWSEIQKLSEGHRDGHPRSTSFHEAQDSRRNLSVSFNSSSFRRDNGLEKINILKRDEIPNAYTEERDNVAQDWELGGLNLDFDDFSLIKPLKLLPTFYFGRSATINGKL